MIFTYPFVHCTYLLLTNEDVDFVNLFWCFQWVKLRDSVQNMVKNIFYFALSMWGKSLVSFGSPVALFVVCKIILRVNIYVFLLV